MEFKTSVGAALQGAAKPLPIAVVAITIIIYYCTAFWSKLHRVRAIYREYPGLPHHPIWGHMVAIGELFKDDRHFDYIVEQIWLKLNKPPFFVMDSWPLTRPNVIVICDAELSERLSKPTVEQPYSWPKSPTYEDLRNLFADDSIVRAHGEEWRQLRKKYGPGFNSRYLQGLLPEMIQEIKIYTSKLEASVGQVITLGDFVTSLTIDIICAIVLGYSTGAQLQGSELTVGFQGCLEWQVRQESINPFHLYNPLRPVAMFYYEGKLNRAIDNEIIDAFTKKDQLNRRSVIALAIENEKSRVPQPDVLRKSRNQIKTFLLAGHDTTSTFLQYLYYELSLHPEILAKVRAEQKLIFGSEKSGYHERIEKMLLEHPEQVFQGMVYTTAVMKEGLRFHSIAGGSKWVPKGNNLTAEYEGKSYLLDCHTLHLASSISHMDPKYWGPDAHLFNPDRWLENAGWKVPVSAFRPFERGPRACIAQELVYLEARIILAFTVNTYEFEKVFDTKYKELYSIRKITAKPNDGMRMRVSKVEW